MKGKIKTHVAIGDYSFIESEVDFDGTETDFKRTEQERLDVAKDHFGYLNKKVEETTFIGNGKEKIKWEKKDGKWDYKT